MEATKNRLKPYKYWQREQLFEHCLNQAKLFGYDLNRVGEVIFSKKWDPLEDCDGCTFVQDFLQPFYPCIEHDFNLITDFENAKKHDKEFRRKLIMAGFSKAKANMYYVAVRTHSAVKKVLRK